MGFTHVWAFILKFLRWSYNLLRVEKNLLWGFFCAEKDYICSSNFLQEFWNPLNHYSVIISSTHIIYFNHIPPLLSPLLSPSFCCSLSFLQQVCLLNSLFAAVVVANRLSLISEAPMDMDWTFTGPWASNQWPWPRKMTPHPLAALNCLQIARDRLGPYHLLPYPWRVVPVLCMSCDV